MKKTMKIRFWMIVSLLILFAIVFLIIPPLEMSIRKNMDIEHKMFSNLEEIDNFIEYHVYDTVQIEDKSVKGLEFVDARSYKFKYKKDSYTICAYIFSDTQDSLAYLEKFCGKKKTDENDFGAGGQYYFSTKMYVIKNERVYVMIGPGYQAFYKVIELLNVEFSETLKE